MKPTGVTLFQVVVRRNFVGTNVPRTALRVNFDAPDRVSRASNARRVCISLIYRAVEGGNRNRSKVSLNNYGKPNMYRSGRRHDSGKLAL